MGTPLGFWFLKVTEHASHSVVFPTQYSLFYCFTLFFLQQFIVVHHSLHTTSASDRPSSYDLHTSEHPVASATPILLLPFFLPCWKRTFVFSDWDFGFLSFWTFTFSSNYYRLFLAEVHFILICEMYAPELNAVLHKSIYQPQKHYLYICLFFFEGFSLLWVIV